jgi:murein DD-endopeptidase MepM/ murein hydrolase activator NlpD
VPETPGTPQSGRGALPPFKGWPDKPRAKEPIQYGRLVAVLVALFFITGLILLAIFVPRSHRARIAKAKALVEKRQSQVAYDTSVFIVREREVMSSLLGRAGFTPGQIGMVVPALRDAQFNMRAMRPGDSLFVLVLDSMPARILYRRTFEQVWRVDLDSGACRVSMLFRDITKKTGVIRGVIKSSLYETMVAQGEQPELIAGYTDIFGWEIDFFSEVQPNDSFAVLVERRYSDSVFIGYGQIEAAAYYGQVGNFGGFRFTDSDGKTDYYNAEGQNLRKTFQKSPLRFSRVSSFFGRRRHPILRRVRQHAGVDYVAPKGTPVEAVADGRVVSAGWSGGYGRLVAIGHGEGYSTRYGHLSGFAKGIRSGAPVAQGQLVGYVGSTGL